MNIYLAKTEGIGTVRLKTLVGRRRPLYYGLGKTILALMCDQDCENYLPDPIPSFTLNTITERSQFLQKLKMIREHGYAVDDEEYIERVVGIVFRSLSITRSSEMSASSDPATDDSEKRELGGKQLSK
jgi:DNA-binding IclR family transcriptional regulator